MIAFLTKLGYTILAMCFWLIVGSVVAPDQAGLGVAIFFFGSVLSGYYIFKKMRRSREQASSVRGPVVTVTVESSVSTRPITTERVDSPGYKIPPRQIGKVEWVARDDEVDIHGYRLKGPLWVGPLSSREADNEPAVINRRLPIDKSSLAAPLGYWSNYSHINDAQRNRYLSWLSGDRGEIDDLGYLFIYFYGFERYVLRQAKKDPKALRDKHLSDIVEEVSRLREVFSSNRSFDGYSSQLLDLIYVLYWPDRIDERKSAFPAGRSLAAHYAIAAHANRDDEQPLDSDWALHWLLCFGPVSRTKTIRQQYPVLRLLFKATYLRTTNGGIKVPRCKTKLQILFNPASRGLEDVSRIPTPEDWCDPTGLKRPMTKLLEVHEEVMPALRSLAKAIAKKELSSILAAWPPGVPLTSVPKLRQIVERVDAQLRSAASTEIGALAKLINLPVTDKATVAQMKTIAAAVESCGYVLVPDPAVTPSAIRLGETVVAFQGQRLPSLSPEGDRLALTIQLGALLALADGQMHSAEKELFQKMVNSHANPQERAYLENYLEWRSTHPPSASGVKKQVDRLKPEQKHEIGRLLVDLALADGELPAQEIKQLEKLFKQLGLEESMVTEMLHQSAASVVPQPAAAARETEGRVQLDTHALNAHASSTREIQKVLGNIFTDDDEEEPVASSKPVPAVGTNRAWHQGMLDEAHDNLASWLLQKDEWPRDKVVEKCAALGLLIDGALDTINEAAFEAFGDSLLEAGDPIEVYRDVLPS